MAEKNLHFIETGPIAFAIIVAAVLFSSAFYFAPAKTAFSSSAPQQHVLSVSADASQNVVPDKVEIIFSVVSKGQDPAAIQSDNDAKVRQIQTALIGMGIPAANIKTVGYSLDPWQEYNKTQEQYVDMGYQLTNSIRVVSYEVTQAGGIVKSAVGNGANDVQSVQFTLSDAARKRVYDTLLQNATSEAKGKAQEMASAAGVSITGLDQMSESYGFVEPMANYNYRTMGAGAASAPSDVSISSGLVKVTASVSAQYEVSG
jgi:uncharacterized protein YggE